MQATSDSYVREEVKRQLLTLGEVDSLYLLATFWGISEIDLLHNYNDELVMRTAHELGLVGQILPPKGWFISDHYLIHQFVAALGMSVMDLLSSLDKANLETLTEIFGPFQKPHGQKRWDQAECRWRWHHTSRLKTFRLILLWNNTLMYLYRDRLRVDIPKPPITFSSGILGGISIDDPEFWLADKIKRHKISRMADASFMPRFHPKVY